MLTLNDGRAELWQWDTGRTLAVDADCSQVHFSNKVFGRSIDVDVTDGVAIIPDILLQTDNNLNVWAFAGTAENGYTKISKTFKVNRRNKPADYVFTPPDQTSIEEIKERLEYLEQNPVAPDLSNYATKDEIPDVSGFATKAEIPVIPEALPNPNALTFTGAVSATYDGSKAVEVEIPSGGGDAVYSETILTEAVSSVEFSLDGATEFSIAFNVPVVEAAMTYCFALINGKQTGFVSANIGATDKERFTFFTVKRVGERLWFMRIKTGNTDTYANSMFNTTEDIPINGGSISIGIETFGIKCYGKQQFPVGTTIYTIGGGGSL